MPHVAHRRPYRLILRAAVVALLAAAMQLVTSASAQAAVLAPGASTSHPYSNPVWFPFIVPASTGCYKANPGCRNPPSHPVFEMDIISRNHSVANPHEGVYAMGAGIVHYGATHQSCGGAPSRGNWIYIDHGNGVLSYYGHLGIIAVKNGEYVTARTKIAEIGDSGYAGCKTNPWLRYLFLAVKHGGTAGPYVEIPKMYTCVDAKQKSWPADLQANHGQWKVWNDMASKTVLDTEDHNRNCVPLTVTTPNHPSGQKLVRAGSLKLRASWTKPSTSQHVTVVNVEFQQWHPSISKYTDQEVRRLGGTATYSTFSGLIRNHLYRVRVAFANNTGWSAWSSFTGGVHAT